MLHINLDKTMEKLPDEAKKELVDFAEFLEKKYAKNVSRRKMTLDWAGKLEQYRDKFKDPVSLQHEITDAWGGHVPH